MFDQPIKGCRCVRCNGYTLELIKAYDNETVVLDAIGCRNCGASYDLLWGAPFLGGFERDDLLSLIEICCNANKFRRVSLSESDSYEWWERLLSEYHGAKRKASFLSDHKFPNPEEITTRLSHRYREWLLIRSLTKDLALDEKSLLDVGAGSGFDSYRLTRAGARVTALESNPALIYEGRKKLPEARWIGGFSHVSPFEAESFDIVFCNAGLHHMRDISGTIGEMLRVLKPGGWMITASDPYRADFLDESHELAVFDQNPTVLLGVNDRIPRLSEFINVLKTYQDSLDIQLFTHGLHPPLLGGQGTGFDRRPNSIPRTLRLQSLLLQSDKSLDDILEWDFETHTGLLAETSGTIALKVKKRQSIPFKAHVQPAEGLRASTLLQWLESQDERTVLAHLARVLPERFVNLPFLQTQQSKFLLVNGWRSNHTSPGMRQVYRRGRWFFKRSHEQSRLDCEILLQGKEGAPPATLEFFADEIKLFSANVSRGVWIAFSIPLPPLSVTETFVAELGIRGTDIPFSENLIWVRRFELGVFEPDRTQEPQGSET
ncbi:MAG: class I SAM-dependent methyltransferase [Syntrophorhabdales bacterium]